jgi:hypothetical protein
MTSGSSSPATHPNRASTVEERVLARLKRAGRRQVRRAANSPDGTNRQLLLLRRGHAVLRDRRFNVRTIIPKISNAGAATDPKNASDSTVLPVAVAAMPAASCSTKPTARRASFLPASRFRRNLHRTTATMKSHNAPKRSHVTSRRVLIAYLPELPFALLSPFVRSRRRWNVNAPRRD